MAFLPTKMEWWTATHSASFWEKSRSQLHLTRTKTGDDGVGVLLLEYEIHPLNMEIELLLGKNGLNSKLRPYKNLVHDLSRFKI